MSLTNSGFDGTVTERDFSRIMRGAGVRDSVETAAAWAVTQGTGRQVSVAPGVAYAAGVVSDSGVAILAALPTPVNGQFHLVVRRINWSTNTVTVATIPHTTTTTTIPTAPPAGFPVFNDNTGVLVDQHLAWAWVRSTDTTVTVFDLRAQPLLRTLGVDLPVANFAALPASGNWLGRQISTSDSGITYRWSGSAWIPLTPVMFPTSVDNGTTGASGEITSASAALVRARGVFVAARFRRYEVAFDITCASSVTLNARFSVAATDTATGYDNQRSTDVNATGAAAQSLNQTLFFISTIPSTRHVGKITVWNPNNADDTFFIIDTLSTPDPMTTAHGAYQNSGQQRAATAFDGIAFTADSGNFTVNSLSVTGVV